MWECLTLVDGKISVRFDGREVAILSSLTAGSIEGLLNARMQEYVPSRVFSCREQGSLFVR